MTMPVNVFPIPGLTTETSIIFEKVSKLECIKGLYLCGGTAQSLQMCHRESEDLDFELIGTKKDRPALGFAGIIEELNSAFDSVRLDILGDDHFLAYIGDNHVKLSFFKPKNPVQCISTGYTYNNIKTPSLQELLGMKVFVVCVRNEFRDYYDIYCLLREGYSLKAAVSYASYFSKRSLRSKDMYSRLLSPQIFLHENDFAKMKPKYAVTGDEIKRFVANCIATEAAEHK